MNTVALPGRCRWPVQHSRRICPHWLHKHLYSRADSLRPVDPPASLWPSSPADTHHMDFAVKSVIYYILKKRTIFYYKTVVRQRIFQNIQPHSIISTFFISGRHTEPKRRCRKYVCKLATHFHLSSTEMRSYKRSTQIWRKRTDEGDL